MRTIERRKLFQSAFVSMPLWEVWTRPNAMVKADGKVRDIRDFKLVPRRLRRQMARARAKREWRIVVGTESPPEQHPPHITELENSMYVNSHNYQMRNHGQ